MGWHHVSQEWKINPFKAYYNWMKKGRLQAAAKFIWTGIWMTSLLTLRWEEGVFIIFLGCILREIWCYVVDPTYTGHPILK